MKIILFEIYYRIFYTIGAISIVECFSYFVQGHQLEYFSGLLAFNYQAVDFDSYGDLKRIGLQLLSKDLEQKDFSLIFEDKQEQVENQEGKKCILKSQSLSDFENFGLDKQSSSYLTLSPNEGRAWLHLFIAYLSYFYCLEADKATLNNMFMYIRLISFCILIIAQIYSIVIPGLLKRWARKHFFISMAFAVVLLLSEFAIFILTATLQELQLEQLDSLLL